MQLKIANWKSAMAEKRVLIIPEIPKGSRLEKVVHEIDRIVKFNPKEIAEFFKSLFNECTNFAQNLDLENTIWPFIILQVCKTSDEFRKIVEYSSSKAIEKERALYPEYTLGFTVGNQFHAKIFIDGESCIELLNHNALTFGYAVVETYFHELLHSAFQNRKSEQEIWDMQFPIIEKFLEFKIPEERKKLRAKDFYSNNL